MRWRFDKPIPLNRGRSLDLRPCLGPLWHRGPHALFHLFKGLGNQYLLPLAREQTIPLFAFDIAQQIDEVVLCLHPLGGCFENGASITVAPLRRQLPAASKDPRPAHFQTESE